MEPQVSESSNLSFEPESISNSCVTSLDHFHSFQPLNDTCFQNTVNNYYTGLEMCTNQQNPASEMQRCFNNENHLNFTQRLSAENCFYKDGLFNECSLPYEHDSHNSIVNSGPEFNQCCGANNFSTSCKNPVRTSHNIRPTLIVKDSNSLGINALKFNTCPSVTADKDKDENLPFSYSSLGMGKMKIEYWNIMVFYRNHSIYVNPELMARSIGLAKPLVRKLIERRPVLQKMTQLEVSILKYIGCLSTTTHNTSLIPLDYFLDTLHAKLDNNKPYQAYVKNTIKTFIDKLNNGFVPNISNLPYDLSPFFNDTQSYKDESKKSLRRFKIVSHLSLDNKSFSLIEHNGDFYMHLGELVSNGLFPSVNLVRRKIRKMHISTKWLDPIDSQYLNLSADQELLKFSDLRILCGLIFYLNPNERTDLLQMFSAMDLSDFISTINPVKRYDSNDAPMEDDAKNKFQNQTAQSHERLLAVSKKELLLTESSIVPSKILVNPQRKVVSASGAEKQFNFNVQIEKLNKNCDLENVNINSDSPCAMQERIVPSALEKGNPTLREVRVKRCKNLPSHGQNFMYPATNDEAEADTLSLSFEELLDGNLNICRPLSDSANSPNFHPSAESTNNICMTCDENKDLCYFENRNKSIDCCLPSASEFSANLQLGNDRLVNDENPNYNIEQPLKNKAAFQISNVFQASAPNNDTFNKEHQILRRQFIDLTATNLTKNCFSTSNNNSSIYPLANLSDDETFAESGRSTNTNLDKRQIDPQKFFKPDNHVILNESNTDQSVKYYTFDDKNQSSLKINRVNLHSGLSPSLANEDASEISELPMVSSGEVCYDQIGISSLKIPTFATEEQLLSISPQIDLPALNNIQENRSFRERKKDSSFTRNECYLSKPNKIQHFFSNLSKNQGNDEFQDDNLPSIKPYTICNMLSQNGDSENGNLMPVDAGQTLTSNTTFQRHKIDDCFPSMQESFDNYQNISYESYILSDNSLLDNTPISSNCVYFQNETSCCGDNEVTLSPDESKLTLKNSGNVGGKIPMGKNAVLKKTSCAEPLLPVKNKNRWITLKERDLTLCTESSSCDEFKECSTPSLYSDGFSNLKKSTMPSAIPSNLASSNLTILSPVVTLNRFDQIDIFQTNELNKSLTKNLNQSLPNGELTEIEEVMNCKILRPELSLQKCEMYKNKNISQEHLHTRSYKKQSQKKPLTKKPQTESDLIKSSRTASPKVNHELEIASMEAIDTLAIEINQTKLSNCALQNVNAKNCSSVLPHFETTDMRSKSNKILTKEGDSSEVEMKDSEDTSTGSSSVIIDAEKKEVIKELSNFNQLLTNNQFPKETSHTMDLNSLNSITDDKKKNLFEVTSSCTESMENDSQSVKCNLIRNNKLQCQKTIIQNESHYPVSSYSKSMGATRKNEFNMKSIVIKKKTKQFNSHSTRMTVGAGPSEGIKTITIFEPESVPQTRSRQISIIDMVDIVKLSTTKNRLHLDVVITEQARMIFENESKDNPVEPKKIFLQQFTDLVCQFSKRWFNLLAAKCLDYDGNPNSLKPILTGKTKTFQKDVFTKYGYPPDAAKKDLQMPTIFHQSITSCRCSRRLCGVMKMPPENETSKIDETNSKGKRSNTSDICCNTIGEAPHKSDQSNLVLLEKTELDHDSSKVYEIECSRFIAKDDPSCNEFISRIELTKRKLPSLENVKVKKKKTSVK